MDIQVGDIAVLKKQHPCGSKEWEVLRTGIDIRLKCRGCGHLVLLERRQAGKRISKIIRGDA